MILSIVLLETHIKVGGKPFIKTIKGEISLKQVMQIKTYVREINMTNVLEFISPQSTFTLIPIGQHVRM